MVMPHILERLSDNKVKLTVTVPAEKVTEAMQRTADLMAKHANIPGFRPGKASYDVVKQRFGEMKILEEATEDLIRASFVTAMIEEDLETVGQPYFTMEKMAPDNDLVYTAEIALMPGITKLADYAKLNVDQTTTEPTDELVNEAKRDLARMQTKEHRALAGHKLAMGDKAVVNMTMKKEGVVLEGGEAQNHGIYTHEPYYVEGFVDHILGLAEGDEKSFTLKFPKDHYQKHVAGQDVDFTVKLNEIFTLEAPAFDDAFAKTLGLESAEALEKKLRENLKVENEQEESRRQEKAVLDLIAEKSDFDTIPDLVVNQEIDRMVHELQHNIEQSGMDFDQYLKSIGKSMAEIKLDFTPAAIMRVKVSLIVREVAKRENIKVEEKDLDAELDKIADMYKDNKEYRDRVFSPEYREYIETQMRNRKTVQFLKEKMVK